MQICVRISIFCIVRSITGPILPPQVDLTYTRTYGRQTDEIQVNFKMFKMFFWLIYSDFIMFDITAMLLHCYNCISVAFCQIKLILRWVFKCEKFGCLLLCQSLLLGTNVLNDTLMYYPFTVSLPGCDNWSAFLVHNLLIL